MRRWASGLLCGASLLLFVGAAGLWARSYAAEESVRRWSVHTDPAARPPQNISFQVVLWWGRGNVKVFTQYDRCDGPFPAQSGWNYERRRPVYDGYLTYQSAAVRTDLRFAGFQWWRYFYRGVGGGPGKLTPTEFTSRRQLVVPLASFLSAAVPPLLWVLRRRRRRGARTGRGFQVGLGTDRS